MAEKDANNIFNFRQEMNKVFLKKLKTPKLPVNEAEEEILDAVAIQSSKLKPNLLYYEHLFLYYVIIDMKLFTFFKKRHDNLADLIRQTSLFYYVSLIKNC